MGRKFIGPKELTPEQRLLNVVHKRGKRPGCAEPSLKHVLSDMTALKRCLRPALSLDYKYNSEDGGDYSTLGDIIDPSSIVSSVRPKTTAEDINEREVSNLIARVQHKIETSWKKKYGTGGKLAVEVFDDMCNGETPKTTAKRLRRSRQRISQIKEQLRRLDVVQELGYQLTEMKSA